MAQRKRRRNNNEVELSGRKYLSALYMDSKQRNFCNHVEKFLLLQRRRKGLTFLKLSSYNKVFLKKDNSNSSV